MKTKELQGPCVAHLRFLINYHIDLQSSITILVMLVDVHTLYEADMQEFMLSSDPKARTNFDK